LGTRGEIFGEVAKNGTRVARTRRAGSALPGLQPTRLPLQKEKKFHDLVDFFFDEAAGRNMLLSR
jgi:hypothetical protein